MAQTWFVRAKHPPGFRRAGHFFPYEGITLDMSTLSEADRQAIAAEPRLVVGESGPAAPAPADDPVLDDIVEVMGMLEGDKKPPVRAIEDVLGRDISAAQRDQAWVRFQSNLKGA
ncbi:hypothetical protein NF212_21865 [Parasalinivibrio latis]|uniref:hypothetical protein n=1 Tax=Parasalinivibrio latis TaxID=2952610 RepID=UPI0030DE9B2D